MNRHDSRETVKNRVNKIYSLPPFYDFELFLSQFLKGFNFAFPSIHNLIKPIAFDRPTFGPSSTICLAVSICIARLTFCFLMPSLRLHLSVFVG